MLVPLLADFCARYPRIEFDLVLQDRLTDSVGERIDVGFRAGNAPETQVVSRRLFAIQQIVCAAAVRHMADQRALLTSPYTAEPAIASPIPGGHFHGSSVSLARP